MPGAETLGPLLYSAGVATGRIDLARFVELVCSGPADVFGLVQKGRLAEGSDADFVVFDPNAEWTVQDDATHYAVGWSPYHGQEVRGRVVSTWLRGSCVFRDGDVVGEAGVGKFITPI
jgi:dihydroorotase-like cyclic amidohydrolase